MFGRFEWVSRRTRSATSLVSASGAVGGQLKIDIPATGLVEADWPKTPTHPVGDAVPTPGAVSSTPLMHRRCKSEATAPPYVYGVKKASRHKRIKSMGCQPVHHVRSVAGDLAGVDDPAMVEEGGRVVRRGRIAKVYSPRAPSASGYQGFMAPLGPRPAPLQIAGLPDSTASGMLTNASVCSVDMLPVSPDRPGMHLPRSLGFTMLEGERKETVDFRSVIKALERVDTEELPVSPIAPTKILPPESICHKGASPSTTSSPADDPADRSSERSDDLPHVTDERTSLVGSSLDLDSLFTPRGTCQGVASESVSSKPTLLRRRTSWEDEPDLRRSNRTVDPAALDGVIDCLQKTNVEKLIVSPVSRGPRSTFARCVHSLQTGRPLAVVVWLFDFPLPDPFAGSLLGLSVPQAFHAEIYIVGLPPPNLFAFGAQGMRTAYVPYETYCAYGPPPNSILQGSEADTMPFSKQLVVGRTVRSALRVHSVFRTAKKRGWHEGYHLLRKNCCSFVKEMSYQLLGPVGYDVVQDINYWGDVLPEWLQDTIHASFLGDDSDSDGDVEQETRGRLNTM